MTNENSNLNKLKTNRSSADSSADKISDSANKVESLDRIRSSVFSRSLSLARITLKAGASLAGQSVSSALSSSDRDDKWSAFLKSQAHTLSKELGELKGSLMKAGQMLSMYGEHFLPPEANEILKSLQSQSPPLKWEAVEPFLKLHLSADKLDELEIDHQALASASMGQVHRARIKATGQSVCIKIQYPDVDKAIDSDLRALKTILNLMRVLPKEADLTPLFEELRQMLMQEMDYNQEAETTRQFRQLLAGDNRFVVPEVFDRYSNKKVITTSFESGLRPDDPLVSNLSQERRNTLALSFLDLYFKELFEWKMMQTDPHIGNYKVRLSPSGQDQLVLLDFGATRRFADDFMITYHNMVKGAYYNDETLFKNAAVKLNLLQHTDSPALQGLFSEFCYESVEPFRSESMPEGFYDWKNTDLPQRLSKKVFQAVRHHSWRTPPKELLFLDRKTGGVFIFLSVLRARINGQPLLVKYLEKVAAFS